MTIYAKIKEILAENKADFSEKEHAAQGDGAAVAKIHGLTESQGAKAIVLSVKSTSGLSNYLAVFPADRKIDDKAIKKFLTAQKVSFEKADLSKEITGCVPGSIPPFSFSDKLSLIVDEELLKNDKIFFNIGTLENSITLKVSDYKKIIGNKVPVFSFTKAPEMKASKAPQALFAKSEEESDLKKTEAMIDQLDNKIQSLLTMKNVKNGEYDMITDLLLESLVNKAASPELVEKTLNDTQNISVMKEIIKLYNDITGKNGRKPAEVNEMIQNIVEGTSVGLSMNPF